MDEQYESAGSPLRSIMLGALALGLAGLIFAAGVLTGVGLAASPSPDGSAFHTPLLPSLSEAAEEPQAETEDEAEAPAPPPAANGEPGTVAEDVNMDVFWEAWNTVERRFYYDLPSDDDRMYGAIRGMVESLDDPYTAYVEPDVAAILREDNTGSFEGIGAYVEEAPDGGVYILRVFEDGPAERAGLRAGDIVVAVNGEDVTHQILNETLLVIRGPAGTDVTLTVVREGEDELLEITITRARIEVPTVESEMLEDNIGYVALYEFNGRSSALLTEAVNTLVSQGAESLILDLRNNPGGFLDEAVNIGDYLLDEGTILIQRDVDGNEVFHESHDGDPAEDIPLVVLINGGSASASEIVAGAVQDRERGVLIGETSFGKGSVQLLFDLSDGSQLRVTYANWYTPDDHSISEQGITPDIVVETPEEQPEEGNDPQLERAIEYLQSGQ